MGDSWLKQKHKVDVVLWWDKLAVVKAPSFDCCFLIGRRKYFQSDPQTRCTDQSESRLPGIPVRTDKSANGLSLFCVGNVCSSDQQYFLTFSFKYLNENVCYSITRQPESLLNPFCHIFSASTFWKWWFWSRTVTKWGPRRVSGPEPRQTDQTGFHTALMRP